MDCNFGVTFQKENEYTVYSSAFEADRIPAAQAGGTFAEHCLKEKEFYYMAETIWNGAVTVFYFIMDNLVIINVLLALVIVFFQRRSPQTVWTWLLLLYFIPILGFILYLVIGQDFHKSRMFKAKEIEGEL